MRVNLTYWYILIFFLESILFLQTANAMSQYFYGDSLHSINLSPMQQHVNFSDVDLYSLSSASGSSLGAGLQALGGTSMAATFGASSKERDKAATRLNVLEFDSTLVHSVLAVVHRSGGKSVPVAADSESMLRELGSCSVAGFVAVKSINMDTRTITILSPTSEGLPSRCLIKGNMTWLDQ